MTVGELIEELKKHDENLHVIIPDSDDSSYYGYHSVTCVSIETNERSGYIEVKLDTE